MVTHHVGPNLTRRVSACLASFGIPVEQTARQTFVKILGIRCHMRYGNLNEQGNWWFGFEPTDVQKGRDCDYVLLLCGMADYLQAYLAPFGDLMTFVRQGSIVPGSEEFHAFLTPVRSHDMKVTGNFDAVMPMARYKIYSGKSVEKLAAGLVQRLRGNLPPGR